MSTFLSTYWTWLLLALVIAGIAALAYVYREPILAYARESKSELYKVVWPTRKEAFQLTIIVLITVILSAILLGLADFLYEKLFGLIFG
ncbi:MAG TPA: preprotein translocase subunit SecE [Anaerolineales bacterium]|nr:preprotein translocase subunit SecE [Anaerolineales bacterium]